MPSMRQPKKFQGRNQVHANRRNPAVSMPLLQLQIFIVDWGVFEPRTEKRIHSHNPLFFGRSRIKLEHKIINYPHCGKIISKDILNGNYVRPEVTCPECGSQRNCKDGKRQTRLGKVQCYLCSDCGYRFS
jgi:hypothetical protein